jgi:hypothetical protein
MLYSSSFARFISGASFVSSCTCQKRQVQNTIGELISLELVGKARA